MGPVQPAGSDAVAPYEQAVVADAMAFGLIACSPATPLRAVAGLMARHRVQAVFVLDRTGAFHGIVSDLDLAAAACDDIDARTAGDSAVRPLVTITPGEALEHAAQRMAETGMSHLAVLDPRTRRPLGLLSTLDIAAYLAAGPRETRKPGRESPHGTSAAAPMARRAARPRLREQVDGANERSAATEGDGDAQGI